MASVAALGVDMAVLLGGLRLGMTYHAAAAAGFMVGLALIYALSTRWAFGQRRLAHAPAREFAAFTVIGLLGLLLTEAFLTVLISRLSVPPALSKLLTAAGVFVFNFGVRKLVLFTRHPAQQRGVQP